MKLYMKQKVFSWLDHFDVLDENQEVVFQVKGQPALLKKLRVYDGDGKQVRLIQQKLRLMKMTFQVADSAGQALYQIQQEISFLKQKYTIRDLSGNTTWMVEGDFLAHEYSLTGENGNVIATVSKKWVSWGDAYEIDIDENFDPADLVCIVIAIDAALDAAATQARISANNSR